MLSQLEGSDRRRVWEKEGQTLEDVTQVLGGLGLGLLAYSAFKGRARPIGFMLLGISGLFHLYAFMTARSTATSTTESHERPAA